MYVIFFQPLVGCQRISLDAGSSLWCTQWPASLILLFWYSRLIRLQISSN